MMKVKAHETERASRVMKRLRQHHRTAARGFTIIELFVVVVIVAVLTAVAVTAHNSIQTRAKNSAAQATLRALTKNLRAYYLQKGSYPTNAATVISDISSHAGRSTPTGSVSIGIPTATTGTSTIKVELCGTGSGVKLTPFDYTTNAVSATTAILGDVSGDCTTVTA